MGDTVVASVLTVLLPNHFTMARCEVDADRKSVMMSQHHQMAMFPSTRQSLCVYSTKIPETFLYYFVLN